MRVTKANCFLGIVPFVVPALTPAGLAVLPGLEPCPGLEVLGKWTN